MTASREELQEAVNRNAKQQRDAVAALTQILKWMGRTDLRLQRFKREERSVQYLTIEELEGVSKRLDEPFRTLTWIAFSTGCRVGEIFYLQPKHFCSQRRFIQVEAQRYEDWTVGPPKNRKHRAAVLAEGTKWLEKWFQVPDLEKQKLRRKKHAAKFRRATGSGYKFHDLRHSYAIHLLSKGVPLDLVAQSLGDDIRVAQRVYVGSTLHDHGIETIKALLDS